MIATICNELKDHFASKMNWLDKNHGLVFPNKADVPGVGKTILPFEWGTEECKNDNYVCPDTTKRSVSWFESDGVTLKTRTEGISLLNTQIVWCNWINSNKVDKDDDFVCDRIMAIAEAEIEQLKSLSLGDVRIVRAEVVKINVGSDKILGKYGFTDKTKVSMHPYFGYSIVFNIQFSAGLCAPITLNPC